MIQFYPSIDIEQLQQDLPYLIETMEWVRNFLGKPHPDLGRSGPVCPFVPSALQLNAIRMRVIRSSHLEHKKIEEIVRSYRDIFLEIEPQTGEAALNKAILLIFPDVRTEEAFKLIDGVQQELKPFFVEAGLMLGEFHKRNQTPGLRNQNFRPLRSPIPMLAIRFMVEGDLPFLHCASDKPHLRIKFIEAYLQHLSKVIKDERNLNNALEALVSARSQIQTSHF